MESEEQTYDKNEFKDIINDVLEVKLDTMRIYEKLENGTELDETDRKKLCVLIDQFFLFVLNPRVKTK